MCGKPKDEDLMGFYLSIFFFCLSYLVLLPLSFTVHHFLNSCFLLKDTQAHFELLQKSINIIPVCSGGEYERVSMLILEIEMGNMTLSL